MNSEINFIEKQSHKYASIFWLSGILIVLAIGMVGFLLFQESQLEKQLNTIEKSRVEMENILLENKDKVTTGRLNQQLQEEIGVIEANMTPTTSLYRGIINYLSTPTDLVSYDFSSQNLLSMEANFSSLQDVAHLMQELLHESYIMDTQLNRVSLLGGADGSTYQASFTITINKEVVIEEFGSHD